MAYFIEDTLVLYANVMFFYKKDDNNRYKLRNWGFGGLHVFMDLYLIC